MGLLTVFPRMRAAYTAAVPALSTLLGEGAGLLLVVWMLKKQGTLPAGRASAETEKKLWRLSAPMTWMRLSNTLTRTAGAVLIPLRLRAAGLSAQEATARLGMLSGMAMPWVMLPGVFTGALAVVAGAVGAAVAFRPTQSARILTALLGVSMLSEGALNLSVALCAVKIIRHQQPDVIECEYEVKERKD